VIGVVYRHETEGFEMVCCRILREIKNFQSRATLDMCHSVFQQIYQKYLRQQCIVKLGYNEHLRTSNFRSL
jgi:hypothetical protein